MPLNIGGKVTIDGSHASGNAEIDETTSSEGKKEVKFNNDMNVAQGIEVGGIHTKDKAIVKHKGKLQEYEIQETKKTINMKEDLNVGGKHASGSSKIIDKSQNADNMISSRVFAEPQYHQKSQQN